MDTVGRNPSRTGNRALVEQPVTQSLNGPAAVHVLTHSNVMTNGFRLDTPHNNSLADSCVLGVKTDICQRLCHWNNKVTTFRRR
jgi:hypothetical protein